MKHLTFIEQAIKSEAIQSRSLSVIKLSFPKLLSYKGGVLLWQALKKVFLSISHCFAKFDVIVVLAILLRIVVDSVLLAIVSYAILGLFRAIPHLI